MLIGYYHEQQMCKNLTDHGSWTPVIPRATFTVDDGAYYRTGNIVYLTAMITVTASQTGNAYIDETCVPRFGKTKTRITGTFDSNTDAQGVLTTSTANNNVWFGKNGQHIPLTEYIGMKVTITLVYALY